MIYLGYYSTLPDHGANLFLTTSPSLVLHEAWQQMAPIIEV